VIEPPNFGEAVMTDALAPTADDFSAAEDRQAAALKSLAGARWLAALSESDPAGLR
jgi:hypothetical protein